tara:strand:+ start:1038 stop:1247 length:210 start_codon:yes stop_codon:yes gene_type:complete
MNIFTSQKDLKKWAIAMANACGGQEVSQTSIKLNKPNAKKIESLTKQFVENYNEMMMTAIELASKGEQE